MSASVHAGRDGRLRFVPYVDALKERARVEHNRGMPGGWPTSLRRLKRLAALATGAEMPMVVRILELERSVLLDCVSSWLLADVRDRLQGRITARRVSLGLDGPAPYVVGPEASAALERELRTLQLENEHDFLLAFRAFIRRGRFSDLDRAVRLLSDLVQTDAVIVGSLDVTSYELEAEALTLGFTDVLSGAACSYFVRRAHGVLVERLAECGLDPPPDALPFARRDPAVHAWITNGRWTHGLDDDPDVGGAWFVPSVQAQFRRAQGEAGSRKRRAAEASAAPARREVVDELVGDPVAEPPPPPPSRLEAATAEAEARALRERACWKRLQDLRAAGVDDEELREYETQWRAADADAVEADVHREREEIIEAIQDEYRGYGRELSWLGAKQVGRSRGAFLDGGNVPWRNGPGIHSKTRGNPDPKDGGAP